MTIRTYCLTTNTFLLLYIRTLFTIVFDFSIFHFILYLMYLTECKFEDSPSFFDRNRARYLNISAAWLY